MSGNYKSGTETGREKKPGAGHNCVILGRDQGGVVFRLPGVWYLFKS